MSLDRKGSVWQTLLWVAFVTILLAAVTLAFVFSGAR